MNHKNNQTPRYKIQMPVSPIPVSPRTLGKAGTIFNNQSPNTKLAKPERFGYLNLEFGICLVIVSWLLYLTFSVSPVYAKVKQPLDINSDEVEYTKVKGKELVIFTGHVIAVQGTTTLKSDRLKFYPDENRAVATGQAWMKDEKQKMVLTGERIEYYHDKRYGISTGGPRLINKKENFTLTSKKMETFFPEDRFRAAGRVRLVKNDMVATCKVLDYFNKEKKAILTGNPEIREGKSLVVGERITLYVDEYRVVVEDKAKLNFKESEFE